MDLAVKILEIRKGAGLTQEEFAEKLFVTRQAVSRWENGETTPTVVTLKTICDMFKIDANTFFDLEQAPVCQSCAMPLRSLDELGTNGDETASDEYCAYCFQDGKYTHDRTLEEMVESNLKFLAGFNAQNGTSFTEDEARSILKLHLASLKRWQQSK
jgi:transcriptional regulator with XRE-family HTH domain